MAHRKQANRSLAIKAAELTVAAPMVVAHRVARLALASANPSARDRKEFALMFQEKHDAFGESWRAMAMQAALSNQAIAASVFQSFLSAARGKPSFAAPAAQLRKAAIDVLGKGLAPVHRKASANAKRLARTKLR